MWPQTIKSKILKIFLCSDCVVYKSKLLLPWNVPYIVTYLCPPGLLEYGPPNTAFQRPHAVHFSPVRSSYIQSSKFKLRSRHQMFLGWPLYLPSEFNLSACLVMLFGGLNMYPFQRHLLFWSSSIGCCPVISHSLVVLMVSGHCSYRICMRQLLMKVWILWVIALVVLHVSAPYSSMAFMIELNSLSFVGRDNSVEPHMFLSRIKATWLFQSSHPFKVVRFLLLLGLILSILIFVLWMSRPTLDSVVNRKLVFSCIYCYYVLVVAIREKVQVNWQSQNHQVGGMKSI